MTPAETTYVLDSSMGHLASRFSKLVLRRIAQALSLAGYRVTSEQWALLVHVWTQEGQTQRMLGEKLFKEKTNVARIIASLETLGYISRKAGEGDGRERHIFLTEHGRMEMKKMTAIVQGVLAQAAKGIDEQELESCKRVLRVAFENLKAELE